VLNHVFKKRVFKSYILKIVILDQTFKIANPNEPTYACKYSFEKKKKKKGLQTPIITHRFEVIKAIYFGLDKTAYIS
jgi:hypothetical protein